MLPLHMLYVLQIFGTCNLHIGSANENIYFENFPLPEYISVISVVNEKRREREMLLAPFDRGYVTVRKAGVKNIN